MVAFYQVLACHRKFGKVAHGIQSSTEILFDLVVEKLVILNLPPGNLYTKGNI